MSSREAYSPGPADIGQVLKDGDNWTLVLVRELHHSREKVWQALTEPSELSEWAPFDADQNLGVAGVKANLTTVGAPKPHVTETTVTQAEAPSLLEFKWGDHDMRWELEELGKGTRLTLRTKIDRRFIAMGAAGWQICFDVLDHLLGGTPLGRMAGMATMGFDGFQRLHAEYANKFGVEMPKW